MARKIIRLIDLSNKLDEELSWRRKELQIINGFIPNQSTPTQTASIRAAVPLLYSHWEGFVKIVAETYLQYVANKFIKHSELKPSFLALSIVKKVEEVDKNEFQWSVEFAKMLINEFDKTSNIPVKNQIQTRSNLWFNVFEEILLLISIDSSSFSKFKGVVNDLVDTRNHIAHGHYLKIDLPTYLIIHSDIIAAMTQLKTELENAASMEQFKDTVKFAS
jgi:hypothetical protein